MEKLKTLYCIIGPSGSGKSTLEKNIKKEFEWMNSVESYTTRPKRHELETGHIFIDKQEFDKLNLVAYTYFNGYEYGVTEELLDKADLYVIDLDGIKMLKQLYKRPIITIGLTVDENICRERMLKRNDTNIEDRILNDKEKFKDYIDYCDVLINANTTEDNVLVQFIDKVAEFELNHNILVR